MIISYNLPTPKLDVEQHDDIGHHKCKSGAFGHDQLSF